MENSRRYIDGLRDEIKRLEEQKEMLEKMNDKTVNGFIDQNVTRMRQTNSGRLNRLRVIYKEALEEML